MFPSLQSYIASCDTVATFIFENFLPGSGDVVLERVREFAVRVNELTLVGILVVAASTFFTISRMEETFNRIWHVQSIRNGLTKWIFYAGILALGIPTIGLAVTMASYDFGLDYVTQLQAIPIMALLRDAISPIAMVLTFTLVYYAVPSFRVQFIHALIGGVITTLLLALTNAIFGLILPFMQGHVIYGVLAALPLFVIGFYWVWVLILLGAVCVRTLSMSPWEDESDGVPAVIKCVKILKYLQRSHLNGNSVKDVDILREIPMTRTERNLIYDVLQGGRWMLPIDNRAWVLGRSLESVTLWDLYLHLPEELTESSLQGEDELTTRFRRFLDLGNQHLGVSLADLPAKV